MTDEKDKLEAPKTDVWSMGEEPTEYAPVLVHKNGEILHNTNEALLYLINKIESLHEKLVGANK